MDESGSAFAWQSAHASRPVRVMPGYVDVHISDNAKQLIERCHPKLGYAPAKLFRASRLQLLDRERTHEELQRIPGHHFVHTWRN